MNALFERILNDLRSKPQEVFDKEWAELERFENIGPSIDECFISLQFDKDSTIKINNLQISIDKAQSVYSESFSLKTI